VLTFAVGTAAAQLHDQSGKIERLAHDLAAARAQTDRALQALEARADEAPVAPAALAARAIDSREVEAIASRVVALSQAQARTDALVASEAKSPTTERLAARADVQRKLDAMIASGRARRDDVLALRREIADDGEERSEVARQIAVAINTGKLTPEDPRTQVP
jgi:hypothetical protein